MSSTRLSVRSVLPLGIAAALAAVLLLLPLPGSLSVVGTRWLSSAGSAVPAVELISEAGLLLLAAATAAVMTRAWWNHHERRVHIAASAVGVVLAYLLSEGGKLLFAQARPCAVWQIAGECPPPGDWSLPSNHATLAFGAAAVIAITLGRSWLTWSAIALASVVAVGRVSQGVHYVHDVALGAILGVAVPLLVVIGIEAIMRVAQARRAARRG
ncbi:phosphatase PAP2 family protein [Microbacterium sp.]|uniref:phosphatase PAP2 family protein n=1 Tax=Microbacterium sp. TaxID=51671 RepID=UPI003A955EE0